MKVKITIDVGRTNYNLNEIEKWFNEKIENCLSDIAEEIETMKRVEGLGYTIKMNVDKYLELLKVKHHVRQCQNMIEQALLDNPKYKVEKVED